MKKRHLLKLVYLDDFGLPALVTILASGWVFGMMELGRNPLDVLLTMGPGMGNLMLWLSGWLVILLFLCAILVFVGIIYERRRIHILAYLR